MTEAQFRDAHEAAGHAVERWSNRPHAVYAAHDHPYEKQLLCLAGGIAFTLEGAHRLIRALKPGDELAVPPGTRHSARVGPKGVACIEAHVTT